jgi:lantibiotic biosynthesis protein
MQETEPPTAPQLSFEDPDQRAPISWQPLLDKRLGVRAREAVCFVAGRMRDPVYVNAIAEIANRESLFPTQRSPSGLASGDTGLALMYSYLDACMPGQGFDGVTQQYLRIAAEGTQQSTLSFPSLFGGTAGLAFTLVQASQGGKRYQHTLARVHQGLCEQVLARPWRRPENTAGVAPDDFDLIMGAAGVLVYLVSLEQAGPPIQAAISHLLAYLVWLSEAGQPLGQERWYVSPDLLPTDLHRQHFPGGYFDCGLAHGIPASLAVLALTWLAGYRYPGLRESIASLADWIVAHRVEEEWGIDWPTNVPRESAASAQLWQQLPPTRSAWCYGAPGIARSLWLAGRALGDRELCERGIEAIEAMLRRPVATRATDAPTLCHGVAGLLQICLRFAHECESDLVKAQIPVLTEQILDAFDPTFPLGFRDIDERGPYDEPAWLTGAPGVVMVLLSAATAVTPTWDRVLAIA